MIVELNQIKTSNDTEIFCTTLFDNIFDILIVNDIIIYYLCYSCN